MAIDGDHVVEEGSMFERGMYLSIYLLFVLFKWAINRYLRGTGVGIERPRPVWGGWYHNGRQYIGAMEGCFWGLLL